MLYNTLPRREHYSPPFFLNKFAKFNNFVIVKVDKSIEEQLKQKILLSLFQTFQIVKTCSELKLKN